MKLEVLSCYRFLISWLTEGRAIVFIKSCLPTSSIGKQWEAHRITLSGIFWLLKIQTLALGTESLHYHLSTNCTLNPWRQIRILWLFSPYPKDPDSMAIFTPMLWILWLFLPPRIRILWLFLPQGNGFFNEGSGFVCKYIFTFMIKRKNVSF